MGYGIAGDEIYGGFCGLVSAMTLTPVFFIGGFVLGPIEVNIETSFCTGILSLFALENKAY